MSIVIGHKNLNLEELFQVAFMPAHAEVIVDSVTNAEFAATIPGGAPKDAQTIPNISERLSALIRPEHERAIVLIKLLQIVKMKRSATRPNVEFLVSVLNENRIFSKTSEGVPSQNFFIGLFEHAKAQNVFFSEKELFILGNEVHIYNAIFGVELYQLQQKLRLFDTTLATSIETLGVHTDYLTEYALTLGKTSQGVTNFKNNLQALTDKSKLLNSTGAPDKELQAKI
jgi:hypothetical protein